MISVYLGVGCVTSIMLNFLVFDKGFDDYGKKYFGGILPVWAKVCFLLFLIPLWPLWYLMLFTRKDDE